MVIEDDYIIIDHKQLGWGWGLTNERIKKPIKSNEFERNLNNILPICLFQ